MTLLTHFLFSSSRRFLLPGPSFTRSILSPSRNFAFTCRQRAAAAPAARKPPSAAIPSKQAPPAPSRYTFLKQLAGKQTPTTLYEAPSHFWFYFGCWSSGLSLVTWTVLTGPAATRQPEGVPVWVEYVFGATYALLCAMGFYLMTKTPNIVGHIRLLPAAPPAPSPSHAVRPVAAAPDLRIELTVKRMLPFMQPRVITTSLDKVALRSRFSLPDAYVPELRRLEQQREADERRRKLHKFDMEHLMTMPLRRFGRAFVQMFQGVRAAWTDLGFGIISVDGKRYKVDVTKGYAHDGFRTLERIVGVKES